MRGTAGLWILYTAATTAAWAQAPDTGDKEQPALEEIVVTAQRREQRLQDVPVAVTALSADQLQSRGIERLDDLSSLAPGLQISRAPSNSTISQVSIRGMTQINPAIYWDPAVGIYVDGVYIGKSQGSIFDVVDLAGVEVLRGPQGTLYGRNTLAGAINLRTRAPSGELRGQASLDLGNYDAIVQKASVDLPQWGIARLSVGARSERRDGWVHTSSTSPSNGMNDRDTGSFRIAADLLFNERWKGEYRLDHSSLDQKSNFTQLYYANPAYWDSFGPPMSALPSYASVERQAFADVNAPTFEVSEVNGHSFTLSLIVNDSLTLKSISGYRRLDWRDSLDLDGSPLPVATVQRRTQYDQISQDLQLLADTGRLNIVAGVYYFGDDGETNNPQRFFGGALDYDSRYATHTDAWSAYGQVDFAATEALTVALGLRYTHEEKSLDRVFGCNEAAFGNPLCTPAEGEQYVYLIPEGTRPEDTFSATTPMASIAYRVNDGLNVYLRYAEGFKSGGFNGEYSSTAQTMEQNIAETEQAFEPEQQQSYEAGFKARLPGGRAQINVAVFHNQVEDLQVSTFTGEGAAASVIRNAGEATVQGVELESVFLPTDGLQIRLSYAYLDAEYDEFLVPGSDASATNRADNRAYVHAPEHSFNLVIDGELYRGEHGTLRAIADYAYTGAFYTYPYALSPDADLPVAQLAGDTEVEGYGLLNLRLALVEIPLGSGGSLGEVALWARNLLDEDAANNFIDFGPGFGGLTIANFVEPRTFGISGVLRW